MAVQLTPRDRKILNHLRRYRITTNEVLLRLFFADTGKDALKTVRRRLLGQYIHARPLGMDHRCYYQLTTRGTRYRGEPRETAKALGPQALARIYAVLAFCCLLGERRKRLNRLELQTHYSEFAAPRLASQADYCIEQWAGEHRLTRIVVDQGGSAEHIVRKCRRILDASHALAGGFRDMVQQEVFALGIVVAEDSKQAAIANVLVREPLEVPIQYGTVPELLPLLER